MVAVPAVAVVEVVVVAVVVVAVVAAVAVVVVVFVPPHAPWNGSSVSNGFATSHNSTAAVKASAEAAEVVAAAEVVEPSLKQRSRAGLAIQQQATANCPKAVKEE